jgi:two-component sensor histidine kinase/PAS domain-containing protein
VLLPRRISTQAALLGLVAAVAVPLLVFAAFLVSRYAQNDRVRFEREAAQIARHVRLVVDAELSALLSLLRGLATSSALAAGDLAQFHVEAKRLVEGTSAVVVLRELGPRQLVNSGRPFGASLPPAIMLSSANQAALAAGRAVVGDVYASPLSGETRIAVTLPIPRDGQPPYVLALTVPTSRIKDVLLPAAPPGWVLGVGDRSGTFVARSERHEAMTGKPGLPEYLKKASDRSGTFTSVNYDGVALLAGYDRSDFSGWLYAANVPQKAVEAPLRRSLTLLGLLGAMALALSGGLAFLFGTRFAAATSGLVNRAKALGEGRPVPPTTSRLTDFAVIGDALASAAAAVEERGREREKALEREALLASVFDAAGLCVGITETLDDDFVYVVANKGTAALFGRARGGIDGLRASELGVGSDEVRSWLAFCGRAEADGGPVTGEYAFHRPAGGAGWFLGTFTLLPGTPGARSRIAFTAIDITERKRGEDQRRLLTHELNHRVKNTLATVQAVALHTLRGASSTEHAREALTDRLIALAKAHDLLTQESWEGAELHDLVANATTAHAAQDHFGVAGPPAWLDPALSLALALALHELATNATKYGALSTPTGSVSIAWEVADPLGDAMLTLRWTEQGGPPVKKPARQGFGSRLIQRTFATQTGGSATMTYDPTGLVCVIVAPIRPRVFPGHPAEREAF